MTSSRQPIRWREEKGWISVPSGQLAVSLCVPDFKQESPQRRGVLMLVGTGLRNGPHDMLVAFSRQLASRGLVCLRIDYSWYGDSWRWEHWPLDLATLRVEAQCALEAFLNEFSLEDIIVLGVCTGGEIAMALSQSTPQVSACALWAVGALHSPLTIAKRLRHLRSMLPQYLIKLTRAATWKKTLRGEVNLRMIKRALSKREITPAAKKETALRLNGFKPQFKRSLPVLAVYGTRDPDQKQARNYYRRLLGEYLSIALIPGADHNFSSDNWTQQLQQITLSWMQDKNLLPLLHGEIG